jgi:hypothetical protein
MKVSKCANYRAHILAKWVVTHLLFDSISTGSSILFHQNQEWQGSPYNSFFIQLKNIKKFKKKNLLKLLL